MAESAALLVDKVVPEQPMRQRVLSVPVPLRFLFANRPELMGDVLGIVYRYIGTHLVNKAGFSRTTAQASAIHHDHSRAPPDPSSFRVHEKVRRAILTTVLV